MYELDPPVLEVDVAPLDAARLELAIRRFRYETFVAVDKALGVLPVLLPSPAARVVAIVSALSWGHTTRRAGSP